MESFDVVECPASKSDWKIMNKASKPAKVGRRLTARKKLLDAAYKIMGERGFEAATLSEIIRVAAVGIGSYYNNFSSKEELARAAFAEHIHEFGLDLLSVVRKCPDAVAATCYAVRRMIYEAERDEAWAWFIVNLEPATSLFHEVMRPHALVGMQIGIENGDFHVEDIETAVLAIHAVEVALVKSMLQGKISSQAAHKAVAMPLQMFGAPAARATYLANLSMPALIREVTSQGGAVKGMWQGLRLAASARE